MKDEELFSRSCGMIMPHVVSPDVTGGEVTTPPILPRSQIDQLDRALAWEAQEANLDGAIDSGVEPS